MKYWISAFRLRTLPLALSSILMGGLLAIAHGKANFLVLGLCVLTTLLLQILSNLANDYGDSVHGADSQERQGPARAVQSGLITKAQMRRAIFVCAALAFLSGIWLLWEAFGRDGLYYFLGFLVLGLFAIWAAVSYTNGKKPYGYAGLGDVFVLFFFGPVAVLGTYYLQAQELAPYVWLPALSCGLLATGVLNVNNIRDIDSDKLAGKLSVPVRLGPGRARWYHFVIISLAEMAAVAYVFLTYKSAWQFLFLPMLVLFAWHISLVNKRKTPAELDPLLKQLALFTLLFVCLFGLGQIMASGS